MQFAVGIVPGDPARIGHMATVKGVNITGTADTLDSSFVGAPMDTNVWNIVAASPTFGVQSIPSDTSLWLSWTLPALNFRLQSSTTLESGSWTDYTQPSFPAGSKQSALLHQAALPGTNAGYFRMLREGVATKLLVLLPGETLAPGTATGKTGTPAAQNTLTEFNVTVQLMDKDNYPVTASNDLIHLTATGVNGTPFGTLPQDVNLLNGSLTLLIGILDEGTFTITASDVTNPAITSGSVEVGVTL
jgi:hypothetical protein